MIQEIVEKHTQLTREIAAESMVLLENCQQALPLHPGCRLALFGQGQDSIVKGGGGSAAVKGTKAHRLSDVLQESQYGIILDSEIQKAYGANGDYLPDEQAISEAAGRCDAALLLLTRNSTEGFDRQDAPGDFRLSKEEVSLVTRLGRSPFRKVIVVINSPGLMELGWFRQYENFHSLLLCWLPGENGVPALADILCGKRNPSGHLADTIATTYSDWPSSGEYQAYSRHMEYSENVYVGYRYFETLPGKAECVLYPFGFGLSYTTFDITPESFACDGKTVSMKGTVTNTGNVAGREVVQCYAHAPGKDRPRLELRAFCKTGLIAPGQKEDFTLSFPFADLKRFDETGECCGKPGSFVLEKGIYSFLLGDSIRHTQEAGTFNLDENVILSTPGNIFTQIPARQLHSDGTFINNGSMPSEVTQQGSSLPPAPSRPIQLSEVAEGRKSLDEFMAQLSNQELVHLCHGHGPIIPRGTGTIGNLPDYGVSDLQTADGPAGIRCDYATTCFPCATGVACSWNPELQFAMGVAIAEEGLALGFDILLAPGLNIHRDPMCGRNFEYFSEDPLVTGRCAASLVRGVQSTGMGATIKHYACNSRENNRRLCNSIVSERALREIYLKGFEIAVREAHPWCIMSSYNLINGVHASANYALLTQILRNEWGFDGVVMTDWMSISHLMEEITSGNDVKMPCALPSDIGETEELGKGIAYHPALPRHALETSARRVLQLVMKSNAFRSGRRQPTVFIPASGCRIDCMQLAQFSHSAVGIAPSTDSEGTPTILTNLRENYWRVETALFYRLRFEKSGWYTFSFRVATPSRQLTLRLFIDQNEVGSIPIMPTLQDNMGDPDGTCWNQWSTQGSISAEFQAGREYLVKLQFDDPSKIGSDFHHFDVRPK